MLTPGYNHNILAQSSSSSSPAIAAVTLGTVRGPQQDIGLTEKTTTKPNKKRKK